MGSELYVWLRFAKWLCVLALVSGSLVGLVAESHDQRRRWAFRLAFPSLLLTWAIGFSLAFVGRYSLFGVWIIAGMALSFLASQVLLFAVSKAAGFRTLAAFAMAGLFGATVALMVWKPV